MAKKKYEVIVDGRKVVVIDKESGKSGYALCHPEDKFNLATGIEVAIDDMNRDILRVGNTVRIVNDGLLYTTYIEFFVNNRIPYETALRYQYNGSGGFCSLNGLEAKVLFIGKHGYNNRTLCVIQSCVEGRVYLIDAEGVCRCE